MRDYVYGYTEIYHLKNQSVTLGPQMPFGPLHGAYSYPFGDTFVVTGGSKPLEGDAESTGRNKTRINLIKDKNKMISFQTSFTSTP